MYQSLPRSKALFGLDSMDGDPYIWELSTGHYLMSLKFITSVKSNLCTDLIRQNQKEHEYQPKLTACKDEQGKIITEGDEVTNRWTQH